MSGCYRNCKYRSTIGYCAKYDEIIINDRHPLSYLPSIFQKDELTPFDQYCIIKDASKYLTKDYMSQNILEYYKRTGWLSHKQYRALAWKLLNCFESINAPDNVEHMDFCQIED